MPKGYQWGKASAEHRLRLHPKLQQVADKVIQHRDAKILDGIRTHAEQVKNVEKGVSKTLESKHLPHHVFTMQPLPSDPKNEGVSLAMDITPYPQPDWGLVEKGIAAVKAIDPSMQALRFYMFSGFVEGVGAGMDIPLRPGCDWDEDGNVDDHRFIDLPHHELDDD